MINLPLLPLEPGAASLGGAAAALPVFRGGGAPAAPAPEFAVLLPEAVSPVAATPAVTKSMPSSVAGAADAGELLSSEPFGAVARDQGVPAAALIHEFRPGKSGKAPPESAESAQDAPGQQMLRLSETATDVPPPGAGRAGMPAPTEPLAVPVPETMPDEPVPEDGTEMPTIFVPQPELRPAERTVEKVSKDRSGRIETPDVGEAAARKDVSFSSPIDAEPVLASPGVPAAEPDRTAVIPSTVSPPSVQANAPAALAMVSQLDRSAEPVAAQPPAGPPRVALGETFGERLGLVIARHAQDGREELTVRMEPAELGRIQLRIEFDDQGGLKALVSADSGLVLDAIRRDLGDLTRALGDAGVRADSQSFRFERGTDGGGAGSSAGGSGQRGSGESRHQGSGGQQDRREALFERPLRRSGQIDLTA